MYKRLVLALVSSYLFTSLLAAQGGARFVGKVLTNDGAPVSGASIRITTIAEGSSISGTGTSAEDGVYRVFVAQPAKGYQIEVSAEGFLPLKETHQIGTAWGTISVMRPYKDLMLNPVHPAASPDQVETPSIVVDPIAAFNRGVDALNGGNLGQAAESFRSATRVDPELLPAHRALARTLHRLGRFEEAIAAASDWLGRDASNPEAIAQMFDSLVAARDYAGVLEMRDQIELIQDARSQDRNLEIAMAAYALGHLNQARKRTEDTLASVPGSAGGHSLLARILAAQGDLTAAGEHAQQAFLANPRDPAALTVLFDTHRQRGDGDDAAAYLNLLNEIDDANAADALAQQAEAYFGTERYGAAKELARLALNRVPNHPQALWVSASLLLRTDEAEPAQELLQAIIATAPDSQKAAKARALLELHSTDDADQTQ